MRHVITDAGEQSRRGTGRRRLSLAIAATAALVATLGAVPAASADPAPSLVTDPAQYVNTLAGTGSGGSVVGSINNFPGATSPLGMVQFTPTNPGTGQGYYYDNDSLRGFALNSASQGCGAFGDFPVLPSTLSVAPGQKPWEKTNHYSHDGEVGEAAYYKLTSTDANDVDIISELTASTRTGVAVFTFPAGTTAPKVFLRSGINNQGGSGGALNVNPDSGNITGWTRSGHFCGKNNTYRAYVAASFQQDFTSYGTWDEGSGTITPGNGTDDAQVEKNNSTVGSYVQFPDGTETVRMRIALSYVNTDNAIENMETEAPNLDAGTFDDVRDATYDAWNADLSKVRIADPTTPAQTRDARTFYSMLYRSLLHPNTFSDVNGDYLGFETDPVVHNVSEFPTDGDGRDHVQYANFSDWDTYRTLAPLQALVYPDEASDMAQSLVNDADQAGSLPRWAFLNASTNQMSGDNASALLSQTYAFGARAFDTTGALDHMVAGAIGPKAGQYTGGTNDEAITRPAADVYNDRHYAPQIPAYQTDHAVTGASITEEFSIDDFAIGQMADALGETSTAKTFQKRSSYWQNLFNPTTRCISPRDVNGKFPESDNCLIIPTDFGYRGSITGYGQVGYDEGNAEQYLWLVPQNIKGLVDAIGGREEAAKRLDAFFTHGMNVGPGSYKGGSGEVVSLQPYMNSGNEPNFQTPWVYNYLGQPWRTTEVVDYMRSNLFGPDPFNSEPGNDDLGAQASWFVWAALGVFPTTPGTDLLTVNAPMTDTAVVELGNGHTLTIDAAGASEGKRYIQGMTVNGTSTSKTVLPDGWMNHDTNVNFDMGATPSQTWGTSITDAPPSFGAGSQALVANVPQSVTDVAPGESDTVTLDVQQITERASTFSVDADPTAGIVLDEPQKQPISTTGAGSVDLTVTVPQSTPAGYYDIPVTVTSGDSTATATATIKVSRSGTLFAARNLVGTAPKALATGNFDEAGNTYQRESLASVGLTPGSVHTLDNGTAFVWPTTPVGMPDTIKPDGQEIDLETPAKTISFIGSGINSGGENTATVTLDDGSTASADFSFSDWVLPSDDGDKEDGTLAPKFGNTTVAWTPVRNANSDNPGAYIFATTPYSAPQGKKVVSVVLPSSASSTARIFAIAQDPAPGEGSSSEGATGTATKTNSTQPAAAATVPAAAPTQTVGGSDVSWLASYYNTTSIGDRDEDNADFDGMGGYFIRDLLPGTPLEPGVEHSLPSDPDLTYVVGGSSAGLDTFTPSSETTMDVGASLGDATKLAVIGAASELDHDHTVDLTLSYIDAPDSHADVTLTDWCSDEAAGGDTQLASFDHRWFGGKEQKITCGLWTAPEVSLDGSLTSITWSADNDFHVLAIASDGTPAHLTATGTPALVGTPAVGEVVVAPAPGDLAWSAPGKVEATYQWFVDGAAVANGTSAAYVPRISDLGKELSVQVTGIKGGYVPGTVTTSGVTVAKGTISVLTPPTITGDPIVGSEVTVQRGAYSTDLVRETYQWTLDGVAVPGATGRHWTVPAGDTGQEVGVEVVGHKTGFTSVSSEVNHGEASLPPIAVEKKAKIKKRHKKNKVRVGKKLKVTKGKYDPADVTVKYRWFSGGDKIKGKKGKKKHYKIRKADKGSKLRVKVKVKKTGYEKTTYKTAKTVKVAKGKIKVKKKAKIKKRHKKNKVRVGKKLKVTKGKYQPKNVKIKYRWFSGGDKIKGKKGKKKHYKIRKADKGSKLRVKVKVKKKGYKKTTYKTTKTVKVKKKK